MPVTSRLGAFALSVGLLLGCGRVPDRSTVTELDDQQTQSLCEEFVDSYPAQTITCEIVGVEFDIDWGYDLTVSECVESLEATSPGCGLLVGDLRSCLDELYGDDDVICGLDPGFLPESCDRVEDCSPSPEDDEG